MRRSRAEEWAGQQPGKGRKWEIVLYLQSLKKTATLLGIAQVGRDPGRMKH